MPSLAHRLSCFALAFLLSGSPAALSACMALCLSCPPSETGARDVPQADHQNHGVVVVESAPASTHAHHGTESATEPVATAAKASPVPTSDARVIASGESCCVTGPLAIAATPGVEWADAKVFGMALAAQVALFPLNVRPPAAPPSPPVPPPSPTRAPLALRI